MQSMPKFEWEPDKAARNLNRHKVTFEAARGVFDDPFAIDEIDEKTTARSGQTSLAWSRAGCSSSHTRRGEATFA
jgi:uncharacterized DUF497 family protein